MVAKIKELCKEKKIPVAKLEQELGFGKNTITSWDKNNPSIWKVVQVARFFGVSVDYLVGLSEIKKPAEHYTQQELDLLDFIQNDDGLRDFALRLKSDYTRNSSPLPATNETKK